MVDVFNVQIFFVVLRESLEAVVVVSVLLAFIKQGLGGSSMDPAVNKKLIRQVWVGALLGIVICFLIGGAFIGVFYSLGKDIWSKSEDLWEGVFCMIASCLISLMGIAMLRINKMKEKWRVKLAQALLKTREPGERRFKFGHLTTKYCMFILPFITTLREGLEAVVFVGGVGLSKPASSFPLPVVCGLIAGLLVGWVMYYFGSTTSLQVFLIISTGILYLISAGLFSRSIWFFEMYVFAKRTGGDASENGSGPGTYDIAKSVWHVNCCNPQTDNGWDIFNALLGWQNSATYGSVLSYNLYWLVLIVVLMLMMYEETHGHLPFFKALRLRELNPMYHIKGKKKHELSEREKQAIFDKLKQHQFAPAEEAGETQEKSGASSSKNETSETVRETTH